MKRGLLLIGWLGLVPALVEAQTLLGRHEARQLGLERMWVTQADVDAGRGRLVHLTQYVSSTKAVTIHVIHYDGGRYMTSERELDRFGQVIGPETAKKNAQVKFNDLTDLKRNPKQETITVPQITLYVVTDSGVVQAIDSETGRTLWKVGVGEPRYPVEAVGASDELVAAINGSDLYLLNAANGEFVLKRRLVGAPGAGPVITSNLVFVPMINGNIEAYRIPVEGIMTPDQARVVAPSIYRSQGRAMWQPVYTGTHVAWPTDRGHLYVTSATQNRINFRLEANDAISSSAAVMAPGRLVVSSVDGFVYCLQELNGTVLWRFSSGEPILDSPVVYGDTVYAVTTDNNLFAIDGEIGHERWTASGMTKVVGASQDRVYCINRTRDLVALDRKSGSHLGSIPAFAIDLPYVNKETDRILLANSKGVIQCFREVQQEFPLIHIGLSKEEKPAAPAPKKAPQAEEAPAAEAPADPFGVESKPATPPAGDAKIDDPFGE
jgi:outer membrane protein assembly factor BamB